MNPQTQAPTVSAEYDRTADALYIRLRGGEVARSIEVDDARIVDVDETGAPIGIEVLYPAENLAIASIARDFGFADVLEEIDDAVQLELGPATKSLPIGIFLSSDYRYRYLMGVELADVSGASSSGTASASNVATVLLDSG